MPIAQLLVVAVRLIVPLSILRWPLAGALASMAVDALDVVLVDSFARALGEPGEFGPVYAQLDKVLDTYYLTMSCTSPGAGRRRSSGGRPRSCTSGAWSARSCSS